MPIGLFIDGEYVRKAYPGARVDYLALREFIESELKDVVDEAYYFDADDEPPKAQKLHSFLEYPPPSGPGFRVKIYWLERKALSWPKSMGGEPVVHPKSQKPYELTSQKAVDVGLIYHLTRSFHKRHWNKLVLGSGDADFHEPIQHLVESDNVDLHLVGTMGSISGTLRPYARRIFEIDQEPLKSKLQLLPKNAQKKPTAGTSDL